MTACILINLPPFEDVAYLLVILAGIATLGGSLLDRKMSVCEIYCAYWTYAQAHLCTYTFNDQNEGEILLSGRRNIIYPRVFLFTWYFSAFEFRQTLRQQSINIALQNWTQPLVFSLHLNQHWWSSYYLSSKDPRMILFLFIALTILRCKDSLRTLWSFIFKWAAWWFALHLLWVRFRIFFSVTTKSGWCDCLSSSVLLGYEENYCWADPLNNRIKIKKKIIKTPFPRDKSETLLFFLRSLSVQYSSRVKRIDTKYE